MTGSCLFVTRTGAAGDAAAGASWKSPAAAARASAAAGISCGTPVGICGPSCRSPIAVNAAPTRWFIENSASCAPSDFIVQPCGVPGGRLAKSPRIIVQRSPPSSNSISPRMTSTAAWLLRCACRGIAAPVLPVNVASSWTSPVSAAPRDALHHLAADAVVFAGVVRQHVHALLSRQLPHHRLRFRAADLDRD